MTEKSVTCTGACANEIYIVAVGFIGGGNWSTHRKPQTCRKSLKLFHIMLYRVHLAWARFELTTGIGNLYLRLRTMSHTIYAAKFEQTIIHQHVHLWRKSQSHAPAHVLMRLYPIDNSLVCAMVFNAICSNISVISWQSVLLVEETGGPGENHQPVASHWQTLSHNVVHLALIEIRTHINVLKQFWTDLIGWFRSTSRKIVIGSLNFNRHFWFSSMPV
jgi:hypothetical protein